MGFGFRVLAEGDLGLGEEEGPFLVAQVFVEGGLAFRDARGVIALEVMTAGAFEIDIGRVGKVSSDQGRTRSRPA
jgi:hypothetical protein